VYAELRHEAVDNPEEPDPLEEVCVNLQPPADQAN
jgi:hypothetical protein